MNFTSLGGTSLSKPPGEDFQLGGIREPPTILLQASVNTTPRYLLFHQIHWHLGNLLK